MNSTSHPLVFYLGRLTLICGLITYIAYLLTYSTTKAYLKQERFEAWHSLLPSATSFVPYSNNETLEKGNIIVGLNSNKKNVGYLIRSEGQGFGGPIKILVGMSGSKVTGIRILSQTETAGLGSLIMDQKPMDGHSFSFQGQFANKSIFDRFSPHEDIIAITGATITSQGVGNGIQKAVKIYRRLENIQYED